MIVISLCIPGPPSYGDKTGSAAPVLGRLTTKVNWLGSATQADPKTTYTYDAYGNLQTTTDPNGNTTTITYNIGGPQLREAMRF